MALIKSSILKWGRVVGSWGACPRAARWGFFARLRISLRLVGFSARFFEVPLEDFRSQKNVFEKAGPNSHFVYDYALPPKGILRQILLAIPWTFAA